MILASELSVLSPNMTMLGLQADCIRLRHFFDGTRNAPKIQFLGVFDTVKAVDDKSLYDISFNNSIQHLRHALALNEDRKDFFPEYIFPDFSGNKLRLRSVVQAWFVGAHSDMGGGAARDGLSLYPLQWMLIESQSKGLVLEFDYNNKVRIDNPLNVVFPKDQAHGMGAGPWSFKGRNDLVIQMEDMRKIHDLPRYHNRYKIHLNARKDWYWKREARRPFGKDGVLEGYCSFGMVPPNQLVVLAY
jgi:hypothetical protein